jgi:hypothetical protein
MSENIKSCGREHREVTVKSETGSVGRESGEQS